MRRPLQWLLVLAMTANVAIAALAWPTLPARIPIHFDLVGNADAWATRSLWTWFALPGLAVLLGVGLGLVLPATTMRMARANSPWLNVPDKKAFAALPTEARERVAAAAGAWLVGIALCAQALMGWIVFGSARVAAGAWRTLPMWPTWAFVVGVPVAAVGLVVSLTRAVKREGVAQRLRR